MNPTWYRKPVNPADDPVALSSAREKERVSKQLKQALARLFPKGTWEVSPDGNAAELALTHPDILLRLHIDQHPSVRFDCLLFPLMEKPQESFVLGYLVVPQPFEPLVRSLA